MKRCPYCGKKLPTDAQKCEQCGKTFRQKKSESTESAGLTNINAWKEKSVPAWVMYAVIAGFLACAWLMISQGCEKNKRQPQEPVPSPQTDT